MLRIILSPEVLRLQRDRIDFATGKRASRHSTRAMTRLEAAMARQATWLSEREESAVPGTILDGPFQQHERLSEEQRMAIERITRPARIAAVVGVRAPARP